MPLIMIEDNTMLTPVLDEEEIFITLRKMSLKKALDLDGMTILFFSHF